MKDKEALMGALKLIGGGLALGGLAHALSGEGRKRQPSAGSAFTGPSKPSAKTPQRSLAGQAGSAAAGVAKSKAKSVARSAATNAATTGIGALSRAGSKMLSSPQARARRNQFSGLGRGPSIVDRLKTNTASHKGALMKEASGIEKLAKVLAHGDIDFEKKTISFKKEAFDPTGLIAPGLGALYGASKAPEGDTSAQLRGALGGGLGTLAGGLAGGLGGGGLGALGALGGSALAHGAGKKQLAEALLAAGLPVAAVAGLLLGGLAGNIYGAQKGTQMALGDQMKQAAESCSHDSKKKRKRSEAAERAMKYVKK